MKEMVNSGDASINWFEFPLISINWYLWSGVALGCIDS